ncbi:Phthiocerol synthesis polyketide synthase type I, partial [Paramuricea clavata]
MTSKLSVEVFVFAYINNIVVLSAYSLLLNKRSNLEKSSGNNNDESSLTFRNSNTIESLQIQKDLKTFDEGLRKRNESVSIVGISCRFAKGVNSKDAFWDLLVGGGCVIGSYPENRLEALALKRFYNPARQVPGKHYTLKGAFLDEIAGFDAQFFGISPAECRAMDPQQRLLLQSVYEAIEDAGSRLEDLQKCRTGVYVGLMNLDYGRLLLDDGNVQNIDEFASTGITASTAANRISFSLNLNGPSLTVDTACSSSLSALNIAVTHLKARECDVAIVCAPNLILARYFHTACCRTGLLAEDGRCKSFDAKGDGYGRGEGIAVVVLKPTHTALLDNDKPYAQILACGLNNDGQTAIPMTAPSDKMQAELARRVLKESGLRKTDIQYVETHGTGTAIGDVVEMRSVSEVYANTSSRVLRIGSVKSNINHTESAAGLAGLIKVCLMIKNGYFVPTVNIQEQKPQLKIAERKMIVQTKLEPWSAIDDKPKTAAVCSYGYGGANAHVIVQEVQSTQSTESCPRRREAWVLTLSARSREALRIMAERFSDWLEQKPDDDCILKEDICYTLNNRRSVLSHRLALSFSSFKQAANLLKLFSKDSPGWQKFIAVNDNPTSVKKLAFIYGGQGNCWYAMASKLMKNEKRFQESIQQIDEILAKLQIPWRLMETLGKSELASSQIEGNPIAQMALFGVHYGMTQLLKSWGITPSAVVGHSLGEISAACAAHVISLEEAVQLIVLRAGLQENCSTTGRMMAVGMSPETAKEVIRSLCLVTSVSVAAVNSPVNVVLSGDQQAMHVVEDYLQRNHGEVFCKRLGTTRAFHSQDMDSIKEEFMEEIDRLELCPGRFPRYMQEISAQFQSERTTEQQTEVLIETLPKRSETDRYLSFLRNCPATLYTQGFPIAWDKIQGCGNRTFIRCPSYPWQERKYWYREFLNTPEKLNIGSTTLGLTHPLLGKVVATNAYSGLHAWSSEIDVFTLSYLKDHKFQSSEDAVIPGAMYVEMGLALALHMFPDVLPRLHDVTFDNLLTLSTNEIARFCIRLDTTGRPGARHGYDITTVEGNGNEILVSKGMVSFDETLHHCKKVTCGASNSAKIANIKSRLFKEPLDVFNAERVKRRFAYGPQFSLITESWCSETEALCSVVLTEEICSSLASYVVHPAIIDACFQSLFLLKNSVEKPVPYGAADIRMHHRNFTEVMYCHVISHVDNHLNMLMDCHGNVVLLIKEFKMVDLSNLQPTSTLDDVAYQIQWQHETAETGVSIENKVWLIIPDHCGFSEMFTTVLPKEDPTFVFEFPEKSSLFENTFLEMFEKAMEVFEAGGYKKVCIVSFLPVDNHSLLPDWRNFQQAHYQAFESSLLMLQRVLVSEHSESIQFVLVTCASIALGINHDDNPAFPWSSSLLGFRRTLAEELTSPKTTIIDLPKNPSGADFHLMLNDLQGPKIAEEIVYRDGLRYLNQIKRTNPGDQSYGDEISPNEVSLQAFKLSFASGQVSLVETKRSSPLNNRVEMKVLQACPFLKRIWSTPSDKAAVCGQLTEEYQNFPAGELVLTVCDVSTLGNYITVEGKSLIKLGRNLTGQEAAALAIPMALSFYILQELVCDCDGKKILVYAEEDLYACIFASVASALGACAVCVAGTTHRDKSQFSGFGITHVVTECELLFGDGQINAEITCDLACFLNRPSSGLIQHVVKHLRDEGKVISIVNNPFDGYHVCVCGNISFLSAELDEITNNATRFEQLLTDCIELLSDKGYLAKLKELPRHSTPIYDMVSNSHEKDANNLTNESSSTNTLALSKISFECENARGEFMFSKPPFDPKCLKEDKSYLVVGGVRGFGFELVRWLLQNGAKTIICTARSAPSESKMAEVTRLEQETGARILLRQADVTSWQDMLVIVRELEGLPRLAGIVFTAMVLEDQRIKDADLETCARVVATKVQGSVILHQLSLNFHLDFFIMFSSITGIIGNIGQLAYSAANTFLDSLCEYRRNKLGLPALSVAWGTMGGAGILERSKDIASLFQSYGFRMMSCKQGLKCLEQFLIQHPDKSQIIICDIDWSTYLKSSAYILHRSPRLQYLNEETRMLNKPNAVANSMTLEQLAYLDPGQRRKTVEDFIRRLLSTWTEADCHEVDLNLALYRYGVDSIGAANMSLQTRNGIGAIFEIYYFIQPKTTGMRIINDTLEQVRDFQRDDLNTVRMESDSSKLTKNLDDQNLDDRVKVVPLYVPDDALVKVFMMHSSHKSALANAPFAAGFRHGLCKDRIVFEKNSRKRKNTFESEILTTSKVCYLYRSHEKCKSDKILGEVRDLHLQMLSMTSFMLDRVQPFPNLLECTQNNSILALKILRIFTQSKGLPSIDETILKLGAQLLEKRGTEKATEVSQKMRLLGRVVQEGRFEENDGSSSKKSFKAPVIRCRMAQQMRNYVDDHVQQETSQSASTNFKSLHCTVTKYNFPYTSLSPSEQQLCKRFDLVEVVGKKRRKVPVILTEDVKWLSHYDEFLSGLLSSSTHSQTKNNDISRHVQSAKASASQQLIRTSPLHAIATLFNLIPYKQDTCNTALSHTNNMYSTTKNYTHCKDDLTCIWERRRTYGLINIIIET